MTASYTFKWPLGPNEVILTGTFDNWAKTLPLVKQADGTFELTVPLPAESDRLLYKYVVDGEWLVAQDQKIAKDDSGIDNNILEKEDLVYASAVNGSRIPEAGGLVSAAAVSEGLKTTVMPETKNTPTIAGEPGLQIPKDAANITAFSEVSNVDAKKLNEELTAEEKKKQKKKVKRTQYKAKKKKKAQESANNSNSPTPAGSSAPETSEAEFGATPEPEAQVSETAAAGVVSPSIEAFDNAKEEAASKDAPLEAYESFEPAVDVAGAEEAEPVTTLDPRVQEAAIEKVAAVEEPLQAEAGEPVFIQTVDVSEPVATEIAEVEPVVADAAPVGVAAVATATAVTGSAADGETVEREVDASPVKNLESAAEEIFVAHGGDGKSEEIAAAIAAQEGDVTVEEIKPTDSEAARLTEEAKANTPKPKISESKSPVKQDSTANKEKKKSGRFSRIIKKLFK